MNDLVKFLIKLGVVIGACFVLLTFVFGLHRQSNAEMNDSVKEGDLLIYYRLEKPVSGSVVVYKGADGEVHCGRIAAIGNDEIALESGGVDVNGVPMPQTIQYDTTEAEGSTVEYPYCVPADSYFILNDYRPDTDDSRMYGAVDKKDVLGCLCFVLRRRNF